MTTQRLTEHERVTRAIFLRDFRQPEARAIAIDSSVPVEVLMLRGPRAHDAHVMRPAQVADRIGRIVSAVKQPLVQVECHMVAVLRAKDWVRWTEEERYLGLGQMKKSVVRPPRNCCLIQIQVSGVRLTLAELKMFTEFVLTEVGKERRQ